LEKELKCPQKKVSTGRPTYFRKTMKRLPVFLPEEMITWLKNQPVPAGEKIRELIKVAIEAEKNETTLSL